MTLHPIRCENPLPSDGVSELNHFSLSPLQNVKEPPLKHLINLQGPGKTAPSQGRGKITCAFFPWRNFFFALKEKKKKTSSFSHIHYFLSLKRPLSDFYLSHMPVANASIFPFYKSAQVEALSDSHRLTIFLFKWLMLNQSQMWRSGRRFWSFVIGDTHRAHSTEEKGLNRMKFPPIVTLTTYVWSNLGSACFVFIINNNM